MTADILVLDSSPLAHFARAGELDTLAHLLKDFKCITTKPVIHELYNGVGIHPEVRDAATAEWITTVPCDDLPILYLFSQYMNRLGNPARNAGEASVLAWAEHHAAVAYVDDQVACNVGRSPFGRAPTPYTLAERGRMGTVTGTAPSRSRGAR